MIIFTSITCEVGEVENSPQGGEDVGRGGAGLNIMMMMIGMMMMMMIYPFPPIGVVGVNFFE